MCGIVAATAQRNVVPILMRGLHCLEYRGYDSAGIAVLEDGNFSRVRAQGKVEQLDALLEQSPLSAHSGLAHTRWATHGVPSTENAHPHVSLNRVAVVHNGIIENHMALRERLQAQGYEFQSQTDSEVIAHLIHFHLEKGQELLEAVRSSVNELHGAYAIAVSDAAQAGMIVGARRGSPLIAGIGIDEHFIASDIQALLPVTNRYVALEDGDLVEIAASAYRVIDSAGNEQARPVKQSTLDPAAVHLGDFRHFMQKEIYEQPEAVAATLEGRLLDDRVIPEVFGVEAPDLLKRVRAIHIVACGTSYHAGLVARYWIESRAGVPVNVEIASEYRYRQPVVMDDTLFLTLSQSGETADTLAALREARQLSYLAHLCICNVPESSLVRESDLVLMTHAGPEIGVASTKAFTTQLTALALLTLALQQVRGQSDAAAQGVVALRALPAQLQLALALDDSIQTLSQQFADKHHALFLGRGVHYPVALEGALKLKEISYIHAEAYPAGELKHGPLALVDENMPVVTVAPNDALLEKLNSNLEEVRARGGKLFVFADQAVLGRITSDKGHTIVVPATDSFTAPVVFTLPLQLLAYHAAVLKGTDVDKPRNLAKSVTVE